MKIKDFTLYPAYATSKNGGDFWLARLDHDDGSYINVFVVGTDGVGDFIKNYKSYELMAFATESLGGRVDGDIVEAWKSTWNPVPR